MKTERFYVNVNIKKITSHIAKKITSEPGSLVNPKVFHETMMETEFVK